MRLDVTYLEDWSRSSSRLVGSPSADSRELLLKFKAVVTNFTAVILLGGFCSIFSGIRTAGRQFFAV